MNLKPPDGIVLVYPALNLNYNNYTPSLLTSLNDMISIGMRKQQENYSYEMSIYFLLIQSISSIQNVNKIYNNNLQNVR